MSTESLTSTINAPDALAASQRVAQLQELVAQAGQAGSTQSFAAALAAASSPSSGASSGATGSGAGTLPTTSTVPTAAGTVPTAAGTVPTAAGTVPTTSALSTATSLPGTYTSAAGSSTAAATSTPYESSAATSSGGSSAYDALITQAAQRNGLDPAILHGLIQQESDFNPNSQSSAGAAGLTQLMPGTASAMGVSNPLDPAQSIEGGARYLSQMMSEFGGNTADALAAYNAGPGAVKQYGGVPPYAETQDYVTKVLGYANAYRQSQPATTGTLPAATNTAITTATGSIQ